MTSGLVNLFQSSRTILCVCPCCGNLLRLSDLRLKYKGVAPRTWLDDYDAKVKRLDKREQLFEEKERKLRDAAIRRGRIKVPKLICKCIDKDIARFNYNPYDIKALLHPIDFVIFNGLNDEDKLKDITFLSRKTTSAVLNKLRNSLESAIDKERYDWRIARVSIQGTIEIK